MKLLAFDTSTELMSVGVQHGERSWHHSGEGGAKASATLLPVVLDLMTQAGLSLRELDAIVFGRGPGSFTGLRTACSVAQGLAYGAGVPVLPVDTLLAVAEDARFSSGAHQVIAALDARMEEIYLASYQYQEGSWQLVADAMLLRPQDLRVPPGWTLAGNLWLAHEATLAGLPGPPFPQVQAQPSAAALLQLAPGLMAQGQAVAPELALPRYIRDKVAKTTAERDADKAARIQTLP